MNTIFEVLFLNLAINRKVNWFFSSCSIVVNILVLPFKDPLYYANEKNWKTLCLREKAAFCRGTHAPVSAFTPPPLLPLAAKLGTQWSGLVGVGSLNFDSHFLCDLVLFCLIISPLPTLSMPTAAASWHSPLLPRGQAASLETGTWHSSQRLRNRHWSKTYSTADAQSLLGGI